MGGISRIGDLEVLTFDAKMTVGEEKWWSVGWTDELGGDPSTGLEASTIQTADWTIVEPSDLVKLDSRISGLNTLVKVKAVTEGSHILRVQVVSDSSETHIRHILIVVDKH